ncbi:hypothetical protein ACROYT_G042616 [Oculina patagonica]
MPPTNFSWFDKDRLAALAFPSTRGDIEFLCSVGVTQLISLTESRPSLHGFQLNHVHIPIVDLTPPSIEQVNEFLSVVELAHSKGEAVAVHCMYGFGRCGTMLACYLIKTTHCSAQKAINIVRRKRPGSIETRRQEKLVLEFSSSLRPSHGPNEFI